MNYLVNTIQMTKLNQLHTIGKRLLWLLAAGAILCTLSCSNPGQPVVELEIDPILDQAVFKTPDDAATTFVQAVSNDDEERLKKILGTEYHKILPIDDVSSVDIGNFLDAWEKYNTLLPQGDKKMLLAVGEEEWTLPIPIVAGTAGWYFDIDEGLERMRIRRIGRNELAAMQAVLAYYDAQMEYAEQDRNDDQILEYAQRFISTPGTHDGLYWQVEPGEPLSPLGTLFADRTPKGGYHGYFYRILKAQGESANGGAYSYLIGDNMQAGFAMIAWPEEYGESGIMSFIVNHAGIVYEQDLGPEGASIAEKMLAYDPGSGWVTTREVNSPQVNVEQ